MKNNNLIYLTDRCHWNSEIEALFVDNTHIKLSVSQKKLLKLLVENINKPIENSHIFYELYDSLDKEFNEKSVRNSISGLRKLVPNLNIANLYGGYYMLKNENLSDELKFKEYAFEIMEQSKNPIVVTDPNKNDNPIVYANYAFCEIFKYTNNEIIGRNCRFLHSDDKEQEAHDKIREAIKGEKSITANIRNYTKDGELIYNDIAISPIFDKEKEKLIFFLGIYKDVTLMELFLEHFKQR